MIRLDFGKYIIETLDDKNLVLLEQKVWEEENKLHQVGDITSSRKGYFGKLEHALDKYVKLAVNDEDFKAESVEEIKVLLNKINDTILSVCKGV